MSSDVISLFSDAMRASGIVTSEQIVADGRLHRVRLDDDKPRAKSGWYVLHADEPPSGAFGSWRSGQSENWTLKDRKLSAEEKRLIAERMKRAKEEREAETAAIRAEAKAKAKSIWNESKAPSPEHEYLKRKAILPGPARESRGKLVIPVVKSGDIVSLQFIDGLGDKRFLSGGEIQGGYCPIGKPGAVILICEGYATGMSLYQATGHAVVVAFNAGNLKPVSEAIKARYAEASILICADDDRFTDGNPGIEAAKETGLPFISPIFRDLDSKPTDFNDLAVREGLAELKIQIEVGLKEPEEVPKAELEPVSAQGTSSIRMQLPHLKGKDRKPISTIENLETILEHLNVTIRYNVISKEEELLIPGESFSLDNKGNASFAWLKSRVNIIGMPVGDLGDFVTYLADKNLYNPVVQWIESKPWDGVHRLRDFCDTVRAKGEKDDPALYYMKHQLMKRWMITAVAAVFRPQGVSAHGMLVLQGDQDLGKTKWFKSLVPQELGLTADGKMLNPLDKDSIKQCVSHWLVELGELDATFKRSDIAQLKAYITRDKDVIRRAYARKESEYARRTIYFGSVNPDDYLHDPTGNKRFWTIACESINHSHSFDMQQVWAEVYELFKDGETWYLQPDEAAWLKDHNTKFEGSDPITDLITAKLDFDESVKLLWRWLTPTEVLIEVGFQKPTKGDTTRAGIVLRKLGCETRTSGQKRLIQVPPPKKSYK